MLIIFGKKITENKKVRYALREVFGIGLSLSNEICNNLNIPLNIKISELTENQNTEISTYMKENFTIDATLKSLIQNNIQNYVDINCVRGFRHRSKLPVRGQRTHSNGRTRKKMI
jgi:small subunit ribosomal protein S13